MPASIQDNVIASLDASVKPGNSTHVIPVVSSTPSSNLNQVPTSTAVSVSKESLITIPSLDDLMSPSKVLNKSSRASVAPATPSTVVTKGTTKSINDINETACKEEFVIHTPSDIILPTVTKRHTPDVSMLPIDAHSINKLAYAAMAVRINYDKPPLSTSALLYTLFLSKASEAV